MKFQVPLGTITAWLPTPHVPPSHLHILLNTDQLMKFQVPLGTITAWLPTPHVLPSHLHILLIPDQMMKFRIPIQRIIGVLHITISNNINHNLIDPLVNI